MGINRKDGRVTVIRALDAMVEMGGNDIGRMRVGRTRVTVDEINRRGMPQRAGSPPIGSSFYARYPTHSRRSSYFRFPPF